MERGLRQKKWRLGEVDPMGSSWGGAVTGEGPSLRPGSWQKGFATYLARGGPHAHGEEWAHGAGRASPGAAAQFVNGTQAGRGDP